MAGVVQGRQDLGRLFVIATPIGNMEDVTVRALRVFGGLDALACEDTRRTPLLLERHGVPRPRILLSYHEHNEEAAGRRVLGLLADGLKVGVCTNAGYPGVSDPGYRIVSQALEAGHEVEVVPGAGAVEAALIASGLPSSSYTFKGFPPKKPGQRRTFLEMERDRPHTLVFFESPMRLGVLLGDALAVLGDRMAAVCIELTKKFGRVRRGYLSDLCAEFDGEGLKGEVAVVIAGAHPKFIRTCGPADAAPAQEQME